MSNVIAGVDEVGRGCLAGPVVAGAVVFPENHIQIDGVDDSKLLSAKKREALDLAIRQNAAYVGIGQVEADEIDQIGIVAAVSKAMRIACLSIPHRDTILVDGPRTLGLEQLSPHVQAIIHGDHENYLIGAASIVAKVYRDHVMTDYALQYPGYGWDRNAGYGTKEHIAAIGQYGLTPLHRATFIHFD